MTDDSKAAALPTYPFGDTATSALVSYLRMEADLAEEKARKLRAQAAAMAIQFGVSAESQHNYELNPDELPPVDENGVPKYKGKKRGRKPKAKKRKMNPDRQKRKHTGYTYYMQETYPGIKAANPGMASKEVISIVAKKWKEDLAAEEKQSWKDRAQTAHVTSMGDGPDADDEDAEGEDNDDAGPAEGDDVEVEGPYDGDGTKASSDTRRSQRPKK